MEIRPNDQRVSQVGSTSSQSMTEQHLVPKSSRGQLDEKLRSTMETIIAQVRKDVRKILDTCIVWKENLFFVHKN